MNELEKLSNENRDNYYQYLKRMTASINKSTKGFIPILCCQSNNILDVGCGSGVVMQSILEHNPRAVVTGIDINIEAIKKLKEMGNNWRVYNKNLFDLSSNENRFDTIIFSSILHEISSYYDDYHKRFTSVPIEEAIIKARELLINEGKIIIRDGLLIDKADWNRKVCISFKNPDDSIWLYRFQKDFQGFNKLNSIDRQIKKINSNTFEISLAFLKEFLYTFTWGKESYPREVKEMFGILDKKTWLRILKDNGFDIDVIVESKEEYEKYLSEKVELCYADGKEFSYPAMTILIRAEKKKVLTRK